MVPVWLDILNSDHCPGSSPRKLSRKRHQAVSAVRVCCGAYGLVRR
jgi:hypothetical protein